MTKKTVVMILIDGFRHDYLNAEDAPFMHRLASQNIEAVVRETFAFELRPAFFAGLQPEQCDVAHMFYYDPDNSIFNSIDVSHGNREQLLKDVRAEAARREYSLVKHVGNSAEIPLNLLKYFDFSEKYHTADPGAIPGHRTLFDCLRDAGKKWLWIGYPEWPCRTAPLLEQFTERLTGDEDFIYLHFSELDWAGHEAGPHSEKQKHILREIDAAVQKVYVKLNQTFSGVKGVIFGDHGQVAIKQHFDVEAILKLTSLTLEKDYLYFIDSTQVRFWFFNERARGVVIDALKSVNHGKMLTEADLDRLHFRFDHNKFGELIFVANDGVGFFPNFFQSSNPCKGLHGYLPEVQGNWAKLIITGCGASDAMTEPVEMVDLFPTLLEMLGLNIAPTGCAKSVLKRTEVKAALQDKYKVSVVVPTYNRLATLQKCLAAIERQNFPRADFEVIVVNDGSSDGTDNFLANYRSGTALNFICHSQQNAGPAAARNEGINRASGEIILLIGDDMIMAPAFIEKHARFHDEWLQSAHACLGYIDWSPDIEVTKFMEYIVSHQGGQQFCWSKVEQEDPDNISWGFFWSSNISFKRSFCLAHGLFNAEVFKHAMWEDVELGYRLSLAGMVLHYRQELLVYHEHSLSVVSFLERQRMNGWYLCDMEKLGVPIAGIAQILEPKRRCSRQVLEEMKQSLSLADERGVDEATLELLYRHCFQYAKMTGYHERMNSLNEYEHGFLGLLVDWVDSKIEFSDCRHELLIMTNKIREMNHSDTVRASDVANVDNILGSRSSSVFDGLMTHELRQELIAKNNLISEMLNSRCWRITSPLRQLGALVRKLF